MRRQTLNRSLFAALAISGFVCGFLAARAEKMDLRVDPWVVWLAAVGIVSLIGSGSFIWWRGIDEAQREAHKTAWYWGGSFGMLAGLALLISAMQFAPGFLMVLNPDGSARDYVIIGFAATVVAQSVGYLVAWALWWAVRR